LDEGVAHVGKHDWFWRDLRRPDRDLPAWLHASPTREARSAESDGGRPLETLVAAKPKDGALPVPTIFHEPWWLGIASAGAYEEATVSSGGAVLARLPYVLLRKASRQTALVMPTLTHVLGPALAPEIEGSGANRSVRRFSVTCELIAQLPPASHVWFECHRGIADSLAFEASGFSTGANFTIEIAPDSRERLWKQMRDKTRNVIRRAQESLTVVECTDPSEFMDFYEKNLRERGLRNEYERPICERLIIECLRRGVGRILVAKDASGATEAATFTVWDHATEYYLMSTRTLNSKNGTISLLIWDAIQHASENGLSFDVDGVDSGKNMLLLSGFGGQTRPRYYVHRTTMMFQLAQYLKRTASSFGAGGDDSTILWHRSSKLEQRRRLPR
jgi:Acetyltransferase (GNAT) domain